MGLFATVMPLVAVFVSADNINYSEVKRVVGDYGLTGLYLRLSPLLQRRGRRMSKVIVVDTPFLTRTRNEEVSRK